MKRNTLEILYSKNGQSGSNKDPVVVLYDRGSWPSRILERRGYNRMETLYKRKMAPDEWEEYEQSWRCVAYRYKSLESLIADEIHLLGEDHEEIAILKKRIDQPNNLVT